MSILSFEVLIIQYVYHIYILLLSPQLRDHESPLFLNLVGIGSRTPNNHIELSGCIQVGYVGLELCCS